MTDEMNRAIRAAAGGEPPKLSARVDSGSEAEPGVSDLDVLKAIAAHEAGLPLEAGRWVQGESVEEIRADAREFARGVARHHGRQSGGLGGGARGTPPMPPSFEAQHRAQLEEGRDAIRHRAIDIDQYRRMGGNQGGRDA
jgi:hypothetical protein